MGLQKSRIVCFAALTIASTHAEEDLQDLKLSFWEKSVNLRGAFGYKDNVLLSSIRREGSGFWLGGLDFSLIRAGLDGGPQVTLFVSGEDRRYFSSSEVPKEQLVLTQARITKEIFNDW